MDCSAKRRYHSEKEARSAIRGRLRKNPTLYLRAYRCRECGLWHLTHQPERHELGETG